MAKLPPIPPEWDDQSAVTPLETPPTDPDNKSVGILDGWQAPDWSLKNSSLGLFLHPQTIAQIDFGDGQKGPAQGQAAGYDESGSAAAQSATAAAPRSPELGSLSAQYESHGNPGTVSSGRNDRGGRSYGTYQFATNTGDAAAFVASPEFGPWAREFEHLVPGTDAFGTQWQAVAARDPDAFQQAQHAYIQRTHYDPVVSQVNRNTGYDLDGASDAVRNAVWSTAVQHGSAARILADALQQTDQALPRTDPDYESRLIDNIYNRRTELVTGIRDRAIANNQPGQATNLNNVINNRYPQERADAQHMLRNRMGR